MKQRMHYDYTHMKTNNDMSQTKPTMPQELKETSDTDVTKVLRLYTHMKTNNGMLQTKPSMPQEIEKNNSYISIPHSD